MRKLKRSFTLLILSLLGVWTVSCSGSGRGDSTGTADNSERERLVEQYDLEALPPPPVPEDNPMTEDKVDLGKQIFFDPILSGKDDVSCATCHFPSTNWGDDRPLAVGVDGVGLGPSRTHPEGVKIRRNSQTIINSAYLSTLFWDGRASSLEDQALKPPEAEDEMRGDEIPEGEGLATALDEMRQLSEYLRLFEDAFPAKADQPAEELISPETYAKALASFQRTVVARNAPYDRFVKGDADALTDQQKEGLELFYGEAQCVQCHSGPNFSDMKFYALGVPQIGPEDPDLGRGFVTENSEDNYKFRTPPLRNVSETGPYMHDGVFATLKEVVHFKNQGIPLEESVPEDQITPMFQPLGLTASEEDALVSFLRSLTDNQSIADIAPPDSVPSGLEVGGNIVRDGDMVED